MRALLDTNAFLWASSGHPRLSSAAHAVIQDGANEIFLSAVTAWEIAIKYRRGRLDLLDDAPGDYVPKRMTLFGFQALPVAIQHALRVGELPSIHNDPFDRMLVSQAQIERLPILTSDPNIARYDVEVIW